MGFLFRLPIGVILVVLLAAMFATAELGRRFGVGDRPSSDEDSRTHASGLQGAMLGLLALMLGFTFSMAGLRFETNRDLVVHEANAIQTAYLHADFAGEPERGVLREAIRRYVDTSVDFYDARLGAARHEALAAESRELYSRMWEQAAMNAARSPTSTIAPLVAQAVSQVIDDYSKRLDAARNHVPPTILWLLTVMAVATTGLMGYVSGFGNQRQGAPSAIVVALIALVIATIVDLDRPTSGIIQAGQASMVELQKDLQAPAAPR